MIDENLKGLYPDLVESDGLLSAIRSAFTGQPAVEINGFGTGAHYAHLATGDRSADVFIAAAQRLFMFGLCEERGDQAQGETPEFSELVRVLSSWLLQRSSIAELVSAHPFCATSPQMWPKNNPESWRQIHGFITEFPDDDYWSKWKPMVRGVVSELEVRGLAPLFRIGQSMHHIIFSTVDHHRLSSEPRVALEFLPKEQIVRVAYLCANLYFSEPLSEERVPPTAAMPCVLRYLRRLWSETKPNIQMPDALDVG
jgi:hypothetical protein